MKFADIIKNVDKVKTETPGYYPSLILNMGDHVGFHLKVKIIKEYGLRYAVEIVEFMSKGNYTGQKYSIPMDALMFKAARPEIRMAIKVGTEMLIRIDQHRIAGVMLQLISIRNPHDKTILNN